MSSKQSTRLAGKIALISGGASGIGAASAKRFIDEGAKVVIGDVNTEKGKAIAAQYGDELSFTELDVTSAESWGAAITFATSKMGGLTTLVNSAGVSIPGSIEDISLEDFRHTMSINLEGTFLGTQAGIKALKDVKGASIVNVASTLGHKGGSFVPAYCPYIKAGIEAGATAEEVIQSFADNHPMKRLGTPNEPAHAIVFLASDESSYSTGIDIPVDGGYLAQ